MEQPADLKPGNKHDFRLRVAYKLEEERRRRFCSWFVCRWRWDTATGRFICGVLDVLSHPNHVCAGWIGALLYYAAVF